MAASLRCYNISKHPKWELSCSETAASRGYHKTLLLGGGGKYSFVLLGGNNTVPDEQSDVLILL